MNSLRILLVADGRSPITRNWIGMLRANNVEVHLVSTYPFSEIDDISSQRAIPVGFSRFAGGQAHSDSYRKNTIPKQFIAALRPLLMKFRGLVTPVTMASAQQELLSIVESVSPDIVHALRIPFEGMLTSKISDGIPLVVSIWGNDLTLHAKSSFIMRKHTRAVLERTDALMADASRDIRLAKESGLRPDAPTCVVPGSGGLDLPVIMVAAKNGNEILTEYKIPDGKQLVINPRGFRPGSVHQDIFFQAIPHVLKTLPGTHFLCPGMRGQASAEKWIYRLSIDKNVSLLPFIPQEDLWGIYSCSAAYVSLSSHDGTPNSFLEAIACGCYPVVGDIASLREWLIPQETGTLVDPQNAEDAAQAIVDALENDDLRKSAAKENLALVYKRVDRKVMGKKVQEFYRSLL